MQTCSQLVCKYRLYQKQWFIFSPFSPLPLQQYVKQRAALCCCIRFVPPCHMDKITSESNTYSFVACFTNITNISKLED